MAETRLPEHTENRHILREVKEYTGLSQDFLFCLSSAMLLFLPTVKNKKTSDLRIDIQMKDSATHNFELLHHIVIQPILYTNSNSVYSSRLRNLTFNPTLKTTLRNNLEINLVTPKQANKTVQKTYLLNIRRQLAHTLTPALPIWSLSHSDLRSSNIPFKGPPRPPRQHLLHFFQRCRWRRIKTLFIMFRFRDFLW